jgi:hypothetical protein
VIPEKFFSGKPAIFTAAEEKPDRNIGPAIEFAIRFFEFADVTMRQFNYSPNGPDCCPAVTSTFSR